MCLQCPPYMIANDRKFDCIYPSCTDPRDYVDETGECTQCSQF